MMNQRLMNQRTVTCPPMASALLICILFCATLLNTSRPAQAANPTAFGINLPWVNYGADFGADPKYPGYGPTYSGSQMQGYLDDLKSKHMNIVRVWLFEDESGLSFSGNTCTGVSQTALNNITDFVNRANADGISVYCMLFNNDIPSAHVTSDDGQSLITKVVTPLANALKGKKVMYDLMNECDYAAPNIGWSTLRTFFSRSTAAIHNVSSGDWVTASDDHSTDFVSNLSGTVGGVGFNFYDYHQYSDINTALKVTPAQVGNQPLYLGEFGPTNGWNNQSDTTNQNLVNYFASQVTSKGYVGMLAWSYTGDSKYQIQHSNTLWNLEYYGNAWGIN